MAPLPHFFIGPGPLCMGVCMPTVCLVMLYCHTVFMSGGGGGLLASGGKGSLSWVLGFYFFPLSGAASVI